MDASVVAGHRKRSADHAASADKLKASGGVQEWEIVIRFYAALRLLDAYLAAKDIHAMTHSERSRLVASNKELSEGRGQRFKVAYKRLREVSEQVRYQGVFVATQQHLDACRIDLGLVISFLKTKLDEAAPGTSAGPG